MQILAEISDEPNRLRCPSCKGSVFRIFTESEEHPMAGLAYSHVINNIECHECHTMFSISVKK